MPTRTLCPKCHGQRTIACPACSGVGAPSQASSSASAGSVMEAANVAVMSVAVQQKLNPTHFNDGPPSSTPPVESCHGPHRAGRRFLLGTSR